MSDSFDRELETLIDGFHAQERLRIWSLVITIFGDAVQPRGGEFWLGSLQGLMQRLRVEPNALRAAMSRLTADGWLTRLRVGRKSFYRLAQAGEAEFAAGTRKIYAPKPHDAADEWTIIALTAEAGVARDARRAQLRSDGFGVLSPTVFIRPGTNHVVPAATPDNGETMFVGHLAGASDMEALIRHAWPVEAIEASYRILVDAFTPLARTLRAGAMPDPLSAMAARSLLIHNFRRAALRDPQFPAPFRPSGWTGDAARALAADIYRDLARPSEAWLDTCRNSQGIPIAKPTIDIADRFGLSLENS